MFYHLLIWCVAQKSDKSRVWNLLPGVRVWCSLQIILSSFQDHKVAISNMVLSQCWTALRHRQISRPMVRCQSHVWHVSAAWLAPWLSLPWWQHGRDAEDETWPVVLTKSEVMACGICSLHTLRIALSSRTTILAIINVASSASMFSAFLLGLVPCEITVQFPVMLGSCPSQSHTSWDGAKKLRGRSCQSNGAVLRSMAIPLNNMYVYTCIYIYGIYICYGRYILYRYCRSLHTRIHFFISFPFHLSERPRLTTADRK